MKTTETVVIPQREMRECRGPRHPAGKLLPVDSFAPRSNWCRNCMSDYDKRRGRFRGAPRNLKKTNYAKKHD